MTASEIFLGLIILLVVYVYGKRFLLGLTITQYDPSEVSERIKASNDLVLLDVRTGRERQEGHIRGSLHVPLQQLAARTKELEPYRGREIVCYCTTGSRSLSAAAKLKKSGFTVANLRGGMGEWNFQNR